MLFTWERVRDVVPRIREMYNNAMELTNLEVVAKAHAEWWNKQAPGAYEAFSTRILG